MIRYIPVKSTAKIVAIFFLSVTSCLAQNSSRPDKGISSPLTVKTVDLTQGTQGMNAMDASAQNRSAERYVKKKIVATAFIVNKLGQVTDIDNIEQGFPRELLRKLDLSHKFLIRSSANLLSFSTQT
ncbi:MAG: hypothetical protein V4447_04130, partial [Pseudomonadota bacterium]